MDGMTPFHVDPLVTLYLGDCLQVLPTLEADSVDSICTDPPYGISFMSRAWDHGVPGVPFWQEMYRVLKPGGYLLSFASTRTYHRLASAIEDAGFEIRDTLMWIYASGFPKSLDVSKALDKVAGAEREVTGDAEKNWGASRLADGKTGYGDFEGQWQRTAPATDLARKWEGWGTALKPAHEPIVMARKPLVGTVAANVTRYGTGALNIDGSRIKGEPWTFSHTDKTSRRAGIMGEVTGSREGTVESNPAGRWPSNVLLSDPELFDEPNPYVVGSGATTTSGARTGEYDGSGAWSGPFGPVGRDLEGDSGGYSRFFIIPKADRAERERGLAGHEKRVGSGSYGQKRCATCGKQEVNMPGSECQCAEPVWITVEEARSRANSHPTVKPIDLMRHLVRLVTPPGGVTLDPFAGSGTTGLAASEEGFRAILIEREPEYAEIIVGRLIATPMGFGLETELVGKPQTGKSGWRDKDRPDGAEGVTKSFGAGSVTGRHYDDGPKRPTRREATADNTTMFDEEPAA